ncbi:MAG: cyclic nucleotide-binding domain-containing protein, partial [Fulvivirga sp.]|uniref:Crp/Fnr family transcriptional regulator n=1 Tax=Fulvivirga sp. TaxID=1931237 RepID=UPI0032ECC961
MHHLLFDFISKYIKLDDEEKNAILSLDVFKSIKKGDILLEQGQKSNEGYFVLEGCLRTFYVIDGEEKTTAFYTEMEGITPHCIADNTPSK